MIKQVEPSINIFNNSLKEDESVIKNIGRDLLRKMEYMQKFKRTELNHDSLGFDMDEVSSKMEVDKDPRMEYFVKCKEQLDTALPILEKVHMKTLCLQDYTLSLGHCQAIAAACQYFDEKVINRVLFSNNGMTGDDCALILEGLDKLKDVKSVIYKQNGFNKNSIDALEKLL